MFENSKENNLQYNNKFQLKYCRKILLEPEWNVAFRLEHIEWQRNAIGIATSWSHNYIFNFRETSAPEIYIGSWKSSRPISILSRFLLPSVCKILRLSFIWHLVAICSTTLCTAGFYTTNGIAFLDVFTCCLLSAHFCFFFLTPTLPIFIFVWGFPCYIIGYMFFENTSLMNFYPNTTAIEIDIIYFSQWEYNVYNGLWPYVV